MGKYDPLHERLRETRGREVRLSFAEIEQLLGAGLPKVARERRTWWANDDSGHAAAWTGAGFQADVDLDGQVVTWRRAVDDGGPLDQAFGLYEAGMDQARELWGSGADQVREAWETSRRRCAGPRRGCCWAPPCWWWSACSCSAGCGTGA